MGAANAGKGVDELGDALEGEVFALHRHNHGIGSNQGI